MTSPLGFEFGFRTEAALVAQEVEDQRSTLSLRQTIQEDMGHEIHVGRLPATTTTRNSSTRHEASRETQLTTRCYENCSDEAIVDSQYSALRSLVRHTARSVCVSRECRGGCARASALCSHRLETVTAARWSSPVCCRWTRCTGR